VNPVGCRALVRSEMGARALAFKSSAIFCGESTPTVMTSRPVVEF